MVAMFNLDHTTGLVSEARQVESPNCDARPADCPPSLIVVHGISLPPGEFGGPWIDRLFTNTLPADAHPYFAQIAGARVSAHFLIRRDGGLVQYVPVTRRAWHAGESSYAGRTRCNDFSIGIELEGEDSTPYEAAQYDCLIRLLQTLRAQIASLSSADIVGHSHIAPGRKTDPGTAFDWQLLRARLANG
jgi:N-acetyl-anhydromuramoyl-L-alanine amidase